MPTDSTTNQDAIAQAFFTSYKPFRNAVRTLGLQESLLILWQYSAHLSGDVELSPLTLGLNKRGLPLNISTHIHHWDLAILAREVLLHASTAGSASLRELPVFSRLYNKVIELSSFRPVASDLQQLLLHMHRLAHQQFPIQRGVQVADLMRYKRIFEHRAMNELFKNKIGLTPEAFYFLGITTAGALKFKPVFSITNDYTSFGISNDQRDLFFSRLTESTTALKEKIRKAQRFGRSWAFTINPLQQTPLVCIDQKMPHRVLCPIPGLVLRRITSSVYYDLVAAEGFGDGFGTAFEEYVGWVISKSWARTTPWKIHKTKPYQVAKGKTHHGTDWILSDNTANLFIECKATRIRAEAISAEDESDVEKTVQRLAAMVVQNYANISEALSGITDWELNGLPSYSVVVTLEDFITFGGALAKPIRDRVIEGLRAKNLSESLLTQVPYSLVSAAEFEGICAVLNEHTAFDVFTHKNEGEHERWLFAAFCRQPTYRDAWARSAQLHRDDFTNYMQQTNEISDGLLASMSPEHLVRSEASS